MSELLTRAKSLVAGEPKRARRFKDLTGRVVGRLTVVEHHGFASNHGALWLCRCECGKEKVIRSGNLTSNKTRSCGCLEIESRGLRPSSPSAIARLADHPTTAPAGGGA